MERLLEWYILPTSLGTTSHDMIFYKLRSLKYWKNYGYAPIQRIRVLYTWGKLGWEQVWEKTRFVSIVYNCAWMQTLEDMASMGLPSFKTSMHRNCIEVFSLQWRLGVRFIGSQQSPRLFIARLYLFVQIFVHLLTRLSICILLPHSNLVSTNHVSGKSHFA